MVTMWPLGTLVNVCWLVRRSRNRGVANSIPTTPSGEKQTFVLFERLPSRQKGARGSRAGAHNGRATGAGAQLAGAA